MRCSIGHSKERCWVGGGGGGRREGGGEEGGGGGILHGGMCLWKPNRSKITVFLAFIELLLLNLIKN